MRNFPAFSLAMKPGYQPQAEDTTIETDALQFYLLRRRSPHDRLQMAAALMRDARRLSLHSLRQRFSTLTPDQFAQKVAIAWLQEHCPPNWTPTGTDMTWIQDSTSLAGQLHALLTPLGIAYYVTGGLAAIAYGEPRTTQDVDMVLELPLGDLARLVEVLEANGFYVSGIDEVRAGRMTTLSITQIATISRADLIVAGTEEFDRVKLERRTVIDLPGVGPLYFASPEDVILTKLRWRLRSQSEKQWRDVLGILKVQGDRLDRGYLTAWSDRLGLSDDLDRAFRAAGL